MTRQRIDDLVAATVARCFAAFNDHDTDAYVRCFTDDGTLEDIALQQTFKGHAELAEFMDRWVAACPDTRVDLAEPIISGNRAAVPWLGLGTLTGHFPHLPATAVRGSRIENRGLSLMEFSDDGLVRRQADYYDIFAVLRQIGVVPE
ncbi:hypothetical protein Sru01_25410 [Sphaerisporangium rufum]|uniref:SnoaL-like domain-containing protein n=1 Tax=Sphaerisporangium rufum TaxID=1381558 RepID=A0A919R0K2_9ACTN|nr:nuclear transport factor 2 family protein [Sphaerisporangium rufum]GII77559.1 hypothetical protein Sru01_25410 [Sphaerisporangium rufum]